MIYLLSNQLGDMEMFGIHYLKASPTHYVLHFSKGKLKRKGRGLAFYYYQPSSSIAVVPVGSSDTPFIFNEVTSDYQPITVQGQLMYRIVDPELVASILNYTITNKIDQYATDDPEKLAQRLINLVQVHTRTEVQKRPLKVAIRSSDEISTAVVAQLNASGSLESLGIEVLSLSITSIKPTPEMSRALEAEAREQLLLRADESIYERRNAAVEQERRIKENELNTEIKIEEKKRQIRETKVEADLSVEMKEQKIREAQLQGEIRLEEERKQLVAIRSQNAKAEADAQAYAIEASLRPLTKLDPVLVQTLALQSGEPRLMVSLALKEIAQNASKIGQLNISPDLLESLIEEKTRR